MKLIFVVLSLFASAAVAAPADQKAALKEANTTFIAAFEKCDDLAKKERNRCRGVAKREHTKVVERADAMKAAK